MFNRCFKREVFAGFLSEVAGQSGPHNDVKTLFRGPMGNGVRYVGLALFATVSKIEPHAFHDRAFSAPQIGDGVLRTATRADGICNLAVATVVGIDHKRQGAVSECGHT